MAKKRTNKIDKNKIAFFLGVTFIIFSTYLFFAFFSYLFTWKTDNIEWVNVFSGHQITVDNITGKLGAFLSYKLITRFIGIAAFGIPFLLLLTGLNLLKIKIFSYKHTITVTTVIMIWLSAVLGYVDLYIANKEFLLGGFYGYSLNLWLSSFAGHIGTISLWVLFSFILLVNVHTPLWNKIYSYFYTSSGNIDDKTPIEKETTTSKIVVEKQPDEAFEINEGEYKPDITNTEETIEVIDKKESTSDINGTNKKAEETDFEINILEDEKIEVKDGDHFTVDTMFDPTLELSNYKFPTLSLLKDYTQENTVNEAEVNENKERIIETLKNYNIEIVKISASVGPTVTMYEIKPAPGIKISRIKNLENDIALSLSALGIRIIAPIRGKDTIGIEVPNKTPRIVSMKSLIGSNLFQKMEAELPVVLGKTIYNEIFTFDLATLPHLLVAGATGQGKSVGLNAIIASLLYKKHPTQLKLVLIDPKQVEFSLYNDLKKHFLATIEADLDDYVITDTDNVKQALLSLVKEMEDRYQLLKKAKVRNIKEYNEKFFNRKLSPAQGHHFLPYIVVVIDEFADLIMMAGKEIEMPIARIAQKARAIGMHMIIATQRPSTNVITGLIKANFPARIAFRVTSNVDSRTILDSPGAEKLIGRGDLLFSKGAGFTRIQCGFLSTEEVENIVTFIKEQGGLPPFVLPEPEEESEDAKASKSSLDKLDPLFEEVAYYVVEGQSGSTSMIQRKFAIGFNRAGKIMDQLEAAGIVSPPANGKPRKVLINSVAHLEQILEGLK